MSRLFLRTGHRLQRRDWLAGAPGLEPGNGGIKIQVVRLIYQSLFRKNAEIRPQFDQEVSGHFGIPRCSENTGHAPTLRPREVTRQLSLEFGEVARDHYRVEPPEN